MAELGKGWIAVDLDGTLAFYERWIDELHVGEPIRPMLLRVQQWIDNGVEVRIFTARAFDWDGKPLVHVIAAIEEWCERHVGQVLKITCRKDSRMIELWDDRAVSVEPNTGKYHSFRGLT